MTQQQTIILMDSFGDQERAAVDLLDAQKESAERPRLYRLMYTPPRQPEDVETCRLMSQWLCRYYLGEI